MTRHLHERDEAVLVEGAGLARGARDRGQQQVLLRPRVRVALQVPQQQIACTPSLRTQERCLAQAACPQQPDHSVTPERGGGSVLPAKACPQQSNHSVMPEHGGGPVRPSRCCRMDSCGVHAGPHLDGDVRQVDPVVPIALEVDAQVALEAAGTALVSVRGGQRE